MRYTVVAAFTVGAASAFSDAPTSVCEAPVIVSATVTPGAANVLSATARADVKNADSVRFRFDTDATLDSVTPSTSVTEGATSMTLLGLRAAPAYHAQPVAFNRCGEVAGEKLRFTTGVLPADLPVYAAEGTSPSPGYVVFASGRYGIVIDNTGRVVWYHLFPGGPGLNFQPQPNGRYTARPTADVGAEATWVEIDPEGRLTRKLGCAYGLQPRMHDLLARPDGSYWLLCDEVRTVDLSAQGRSAQSRVIGTMVQHRTINGDVAFSWSTFDHMAIDLKALEPGDLGGTTINWTHANALDIDADGGILISFRNLNEIVKVDPQTDLIVWRLGGLQNQFTFENSASPPFARQHGARSTGRGSLILLDNLGNPGPSRAERYELDEVRKVARLKASYASSTGSIALLGGNTQPLSGDRTLVSYGNGAGVEEYDSAGNVVWRITGDPGYVFRAQRIRSLYKPGVGDPR